jgi:hypothetical protein
VFISSLKQEYTIPIIKILSFIFTSPASIFLYILTSSQLPPTGPTHQPHPFITLPPNPSTLSLGRGVGPASVSPPPSPPKDPPPSSVSLLPTHRRLRGGRPPGQRRSRGGDVSWPAEEPRRGSLQDDRGVEHGRAELWRPGRGAAWRGEEQDGVRMRPRPCSPALSRRTAELLLRVGTVVCASGGRGGGRRFGVELQQRIHTELIPFLPTVGQTSIYV